MVFGDNHLGDFNILTIICAIFENVLTKLNPSKHLVFS